MMRAGLYGNIFGKWWGGPDGPHQHRRVILVPGDEVGHGFKMVKQSLTDLRT